MKGIPNIKASTLNKNVKLVGSTKIAKEGGLLHTKIPVKTTSAGGYSYTSTLKDLLVRSPAFAEDKIVMLDGKPYVKWLHSSTIIEQLNNAKLRASLHSDPFREILTRWFELAEDRFNYIEITQQSQEIEATVRTKANPDKNGLVSIKNAVRAVAEFCKITNTEEIIKILYTQVNQQDKVLYTYETDCFIEQHYHQLHKTNRLVTCMNKGIGDDNLVHTHFVKCDIDLVEKSRTIKVDTPLAFTANVEGFNHSPNVRLLLTSWKSPDELANSTEYGFIGRAVALVKDDLYNIVKYYGTEGTTKLLPENVRFVNTLKGAVVRGYKSDTINLNCAWGISARYILPYIDGEDNVMCMSEEDYLDEIGRPYKLFTVVDGHKYRMESYSDSDPINKVVLSQRLWVSEPVRYNDIVCPIMKEELSYENSIKLNGRYVYWKLGSDNKADRDEMLFVLARRQEKAKREFLKHKADYEMLQALYSEFSERLEHK